MGDVVETVLDFLRRHHFSKAEAAFRAELLAREGERPCPSSVDVLDRDLKLRLFSLQSVDHPLGSEQTSISAPEGDTFKSSVNQGEETGEILSDRWRSPPEENLCAEYESVILECRESLSPKLECQEALDTSGQEFLFENLRNSLDPEISAGSYPPSGKYDLKAALQFGNRVLQLDDVATTQGMGWTNSFQQQEESLPCTLSVGSLEDLVEKGHARQITIESAELTWEIRGPQGQQYVGNVDAFDTLRGLQGVRNEVQQDELSKQSQLHGNELHREQHTEDSGFGFQPSKVPCRIEKKECSKKSTKLECSTFQSEVEAPFPDVSATKGRMDCLEETVKETGDRSVQGETGTEELLKKGFIANLIQERFIHDSALKTALPFPLVLSSEEKKELVSLECTQPKKRDVVKRSGSIQGDAGRLQETRGVLAGDREAHVELIVGKTQEELISYSGLHCHEELRRLPPVRLHSMDKNIDNSKDDGSPAENSTKSFESANYRSIGSTPEESSARGTFMDVPLAEDASLAQDVSSGLKWPVSRPSVSQGIVESMSEQHSGLATASDRHVESAREFLDEYGDSDTYEDDDDPGYVRQPIEDEAWFFANEIDHPSDDERARHGVDKINQNGYKQLGKPEKDHHSFVEEESYFSGEEYYRSQGAKAEQYRLQQSEFRKQAARAQLTYNNSDSSDNDKDLLTLPRGVDGNDYNGQFFDAEGLDMMRSEQVWKGFIGENNELEQESTVSGGDRLEGAIGQGVDYEGYGSVKSGGVMVSSDAADVGSEVRDSLLGGSSQEDIESLRDQELAAYSRSPGSFSENEERHAEGKNAPVQHLDEEEEEERDVILRYYNEAWGHTKRTVEREVGNSAIMEQAVLKNELAKITHQDNDRNKEVQDNSASVFGGFSFPSPSSTGDIVDSRAGSGKSLWSNRESAAQGEETDEFSKGMVGPDNTLAAWKRKSDGSSLIICPSEENLPNLILSNHSTDEYVSLDAREDGIEEPDLGETLECGQALTADEEDATDVQALGIDEEQYEIFDLRIIHRRNRTGFEEDKDFPVVINSVIAGRYHVTEYLGSAAFSKAIQAHDLYTGMDVCMKIIKNNKDFFDQSLDEIKLLKFINKHDPADKYHILRLYDYFYHREHLFIVCELLRANLYEFHKFNRESGGEVYFIMPRLQSITRQCLEALEFLHRLGIIHCDLKPENILVKSYSRCEIKIIDLGSSCFQTDHLCSYVQSRSYRAPEVILGLPYDQKIDIWSLGCILAELCSGNVLFQNDSLATLLARVVGILGPIDPEVLAKGRDTHKFFTKNHMLYERNQDNNRLEYLLPKKTSLSHRLPMGDKGFVEFVGHLLQNNPARRPSAAEALKHPWLSHPYEPISS